MSVSRTLQAYTAPRTVSDVTDLAERIRQGLNQLFARPPLVPPPEPVSVKSVEVSPEIRAAIFVTLETMKDFGTTQRICSVLNDPDASLAMVAGEISRDPVLTGRILKAANSAFFGNRNIDSVREAITLLGTRHVKTILFLHGLRGVIRKKGGLTDLVVEALWQHSVLTSICAHHVAHAFPGTDPESLFTLGLLHDIGKFVNADRFHLLNDTGEYTIPYATGFNLSDERKLFGIDHARIAGLAFERWGLAPLLVEVAAGHHELPGLEDSDGDVARRCYGTALFMANQAAKVLADDLYRPLFDVQNLPHAFRGIVNRQDIEDVLISAELSAEVGQARMVLLMD